MEVKEAMEFVERLLTSDPYSEDIFLPIPKEDFNKINNLLKEEMGYPLDRLSGNVGRELYKPLKNSKELRKIIALLQRGEKYEMIVEEIDNEFGDGILQNENGFGVKLEHLIEIKKQKYFPKEASQDKS